MPVRWKESTVTAPGAPVVAVMPAPVHCVPSVMVAAFTVMLKPAMSVAVQPHATKSRSALVPSNTPTHPRRLPGMLLHAIALPK